ncbi:phosphatase PAP2 family protein [Cellulomonas sp. zg-ZUI188]|uniref:Phosphatase PAP2 family protein n=2 Tax=Cellulomonas fengjieae TaxID=2819978 RepID=A0ABS3SDJ7_9CELL|nr:phosphatase PAP2 family protein [Cellulomonas fengjieae]MBO3101420.1 phosphatase PAP2 family protein [Cellulomonas fengjieae]QVI67936.1 phosphatase PAP2 family protein [Cellulomonas fengjieae]
MRRIQEVAGDGPLPSLARGYSSWGEHARGWLALGVVGAAVDRDRRRLWLGVSAAAFGAHAGAVVLKRVVRRKRPNDPRVAVLTSTPSDLSFPSAHVASTTAAVVALAPLVGMPFAVAAAGGMAFSRVLLGVHYPSDVAVGAALGAVSAVVVRRVASDGR